MQQFSFFDESLVAADRVVIADLGSVIRRRDAAEVLAEITAASSSEEPAMVVIDSFKALRDLLGDASAMRTFIYDLAVHMSTWGAVSLFVGEYTPDEMATFSEFAIADGIIRLVQPRQELRAIREVEVLKLRGADVVTGGHFFEIAGDGLAFFPRVRGPGGRDRPSRRRSTSARRPASPGLDEMLGGGLPRGSATVVQGGTGTGKTLLGLQFLLEGARNGEPGIHFALEETTNQLRRIAQRSRLGSPPVRGAADSSPSATSRPSSCRPIVFSIGPGDRWSGWAPGGRCSTA